MRSIEPEDPALTYASVLDALPIVAYLARADGTISYLSRGWKELVGIEPKDILGENYPSIIHPDQRDQAVRTWLAAHATGATYRDEIRIRFGDGTYRWIASEANPMRDPTSARIVGWFGTITEIDDRKRSEEAVREQLEFNTRLLESSGDCIKTLDLAGRLIAMSENGRKLLGIADLDAYIGSSWLAFWAGDDLVAARTAIADAIDGASGRFVGYYAVAGESRWFDVAVTAILDAAGKPERLLVVSRDITAQRLANDALRESAQRYHAITQALPGLAWSASPEGHLDFVGEQIFDVHGIAESSVLGEHWIDALHPDDRDSAQRRWLESVTTGEPYETTFRMKMADGSFRWQLVRGRPVRNDAGAITRWVGVNTDVDDRFRADEAREAFVALAENSNDFIGIFDLDGNTTYVNKAGRDLLDVGAIDGKLPSTLEAYFYEADLPYAQTEIVPTLRHAGRWLGDVRFRNFKTGAPLPVTYNAFALTDSSGNVKAFATVSHDLRRRIAIESGLRLLSKSGAAMASLDLAEILRDVARAFVPEFASYCVIDAVADERTHRTAVHRDDAKSHLLDDLPHPTGENPIARAIAHGLTTLTVVDARRIADLTPERERVARELDTRSFACVPIITPAGVTVGALSCGRDGEHASGHLTTDDLRFIEEAARRAGSAIANARLYERERRVAVELQAASLPTSLPQIPHLALSAAYRPGSDEATIGGDWYDAFVLADGRIAMTVGDVLGHGLHAAITMTKLRQAMQSAAMIVPDPNVMLDVADKTLRLVDADTYATAIAAIYDPRDATLIFASAGHPGPTIRNRDGTIEECSSPGTMLGLRVGNERSVAERAIVPGSTIVFFTDGLIEATRDTDIGTRRLRDALDREDVLSASEPAQQIVRHVLGAVEATDDIAVLVLQTLHRDADAQPVRATPPQRELDGASQRTSWSFASHDAAAARALRHSFAAYAKNVAGVATALDTTAAEIVVGELVGNVDRHAPGSVHVRAEWGSTDVSVSVTSDGPSFALHADLPEDLLAETGRGLFLVRSLTKTLRVTSDMRGRCRVDVVIPLAI